MTTYRKRLKDKNGDTIIPALSGDETKWIKNSDIGDEVVKSDNIDWATINKLVWANPNKTVPFAAQSITTQPTNVNRPLLISFAINTNVGGTVRHTAIIPPGFDAGDIAMVALGNTMHLERRYVKRNSATSISFGAGQFSGTSYGSYDENNGACVPIAIWQI